MLSKIIAQSIEGLHPQAIVHLPAKNLRAIGIEPGKELKDDRLCSAAVLTVRSALDALPGEVAEVASTGNEVIDPSPETVFDESEVENETMGFV